MRREIFPKNVPMYGLAQIVALGHHWGYANLQKPLLHVLTVAARQRYGGYEHEYEYEYDEICDLLGDLALVVRAWTQAAFWYEKAFELASSNTVDSTRWDDLAFVFEQAGDFRKARRYQRMFDSKEKRDHRRSTSCLGRKKRLSSMDRREGRWMSLLFRNSPQSVQRRIAHHTDRMGCAIKRRVYGVEAQSEKFL